MTIHHEPTMPTGIYVFEAELTERDVDTLRRIAAEARADGVKLAMDVSFHTSDLSASYQEGRADALREAADRVRALRNTYAADAIADGYLQTKSRTELVIATLDAVLVILTEKES